MVSSGRSRRGRVGLDRSGSAIQALVAGLALSAGPNLTYEVSFDIAMLQISNRLNCSDLPGIADG